MKIQFGCGGNILEGWVNHDAEIDIRKTLPYENNVADYVFCEHLIEHVTHREAYRFLEECFRILKPQGVLRIAYPDAVKMMIVMTEEYRQWIKENKLGDGTLQSALKNILFNHGHQAMWDKDLMATVLETIGFKVVIWQPIGRSFHDDLRNIEGHWKAIGVEMNRIETNVMEATKP